MMATALGFPRPVITARAADAFLDARADAIEDDQPGLGELLYAIDRIVAEETGDPYLRVMVAASIHAVPVESLAKAGVGPATRLVACVLLALAAHLAGDGPGVWDYFWRAHALEPDSAVRVADCGRAFSAAITEQACQDAEAAL